MKHTNDAGGSNFQAFEERMRAEGIPDLAIRVFHHYYTEFFKTSTGLISDADILPVTELPKAENFPESYRTAGESALPHTLFIRLNGGLGTSMGLSRVKSLLQVKEGLTIFDIIVNQALKLNVPLVLMNSFNTHEDTIAALQKYPVLLEQNIPPYFVQHKIPKIARDDAAPIQWTADPILEWCPPGHGDIYTALVTTGMLDRMLNEGYQYAFVSNSDNLGAVLDATILGYFVAHEIPFMMEVAERTLADQKGGHVAQRRDGQLILREFAQCPPEDVETFQDISHHRYFNTNSLWINLRALKHKLDQNEQMIILPLIKNEKTVDPRDSSSPAVVQLETAMGAAIAVFDGSQVLSVPRTRMVPIKTTNDLLAVRSDAFQLTEMYTLALHPEHPYLRPIVNLDPRYYKLIDDLDRRFPYGPPSLVHCRSLEVEGDMLFGQNIVIQGDVKIVNTTDQPAFISNLTLKDTEHRI
jgi:UTP--glucose-1-phosphate uridylyltransferase